MPSLLPHARDPSGSVDAGAVPYARGHAEAIATRANHGYTRQAMSEKPITSPPPPDSRDDGVRGWARRATEAKEAAMTPEERIHLALVLGRRMKALKKAIAGDG